MSPQQKSAGPSDGHSTVRRLAKVLLLLLAAAVGLVLLAVLALQSSALRGRVLARLLSELDAATPGALAIASAEWSQPTRIEIAGLSWHSGRDTLASVDSLVVAFDALALLRRDLLLRHLRLRNASLDLPGLRDRFAADTVGDHDGRQRPAEQSAPKESGGIPWVREGRVDALPSIAVRDLRADMDRLRLSEETTLADLRIRGRFDIRQGRPLRAALDTLHLALPDEAVALESGELAYRTGGPGLLRAAFRGRLGPQWPVTVRATIAEDDSVQVVVRRIGEEEPPSGAGLHVQGRLLRENGRLRGLGAVAWLRIPPTEELRGIPLLEAEVDRLPRFEGLGAALAGSVHTHPSVRGVLRVNVDPDDWVRRARGRFSFGPGVARADSVELEFADVRLRGHWRKQAGEHAVQARVTVQGTEWLEPLGHRIAAVESLAAEATVRAEGPPEALRIELRVDGGARAGGIAVDDLSLAAAGSVDPSDPVRFAIGVLASGMRVRGAGELSYADHLEASLTPWHIAPAAAGEEVNVAEPPEAFAEDAGGAVSYDPARDSLGVTGLRVEGAVGTFGVDGSLVRGRGRFHVRAQWPEAPRVLRRWVASDSADWAALRSRWRPPYALTADVRLLPTARGDSIAADGELGLPGPLVLGPLVGIPVDVDSLRDLKGTIRLRNRPRAGQWTGELDLSATEWIDRLQVSLSRRVRVRAGPHAGGSDEADRAGSVYRVDSLRADVLGLQAQGHGETGGERVRGALSIDLQDARWLRRLLPGWSDSARAELHVDAELSGTRRRPRLDATYRGALRRATWTVPRFEGWARYDSLARWEAALRLPRGASGGVVVVDSAQVTVLRSPAAGGSSTSVAVHVRGHPVDLAASAGILLAEGWRITADSLQLGFGGKTLAARAPVVLRVPGEGRAATVDSFHLEGSLGVLQGRFQSDAAGVHAGLDAVLDPGPRPVWPAWPAGLWPARLEIHARAAPDDTTRLNLEARGLQIGPDEGIVLRLRGYNANGDLHADLEAERGDDPILAVRGRYPATVELLPPTFVSHSDTALAQAALNGFPLPAVARNPLRAPGYLDRGEQERAPRVVARAQMTGPLRRLRLGAAGSVSFAGYQDLERHRLEFLARGLPSGASGGGITEGVRVNSIIAALFDPDSLALELSGLPEARPGLSLQWSGTDGDRELFAGRLSAPAVWAGEDSSSADSAQTAIDLTMRADEMPIEDLTRLIPRVQRLDGGISFDLVARGSGRDPDLEGTFSLADAQVVLRGGNHATGSGRLRLGGTARAPAVKGSVTVNNGRIQIPEGRKDLHPREGGALLWDQERLYRATPPVPVADSVTASGQTANDTPPESPPRASRRSGPSPADSATTRRPRATNASASPSGAGVELDTHILIPSGVWLTGRGLEVELTGDLTVMRSPDSGTPIALLGTLEARRGSMEFHGRRLQVAEGTVTFYGSPEPNPSLDIRLYKEHDGIRVTVHVTGTLKDPSLSLESQPEMTQSDILAFLIFGKRSEGLDHAQSRRLEERALTTAEQFAASRLAQEIRRELGYAVLRYEGGGADSLGRSVTIGKYLSPDLLVKYEQSLEEPLGVGVVVEYYLGSGFELEMHTRRNDQDGIIVSWDRSF